MTNNQKKSAKIFAVVNQKGGVGKTLVIDCDPQGNASTGFGILQSQRQKNIYDILVGEASMREAIIQHKIPNLNIITSTVDLAAAEVELVNLKGREYCLNNAIKNVIHDYDIIIIDCPPSLGLLTINALVASDRVLIPMQCEFFSLEGLSHLLTSLELVKENLNHNLQISGIILTMHDCRNKLTEQVEQDVRSFLGKKVFKNSIPRNVKLSEAPSHGIPGIIYDAKSSGAISYMKLAKEILSKEKA